MPKRKHVKRKLVVPCTDANQHAKESIETKKRLAEIMERKYKDMMKQYEDEMKRREETKPVVPEAKAKVIDPANA